MTNTTVYIGGSGIISPLGWGIAETESALRENRSAIAPLSLFSPLRAQPLPVGQVKGLEDEADLPRTHRLARLAAAQAMSGISTPPDAVIIGTTTGGIDRTEKLLRGRQSEKELYRWHGLSSVAGHVAREIGCTGPAMAVSTACSSGTAAIALGLMMLRSGRAGTVLAGGVDALCRLTYFGFFSLQLVDHNGCRPLDLNRQGLAVAEGAGMLLLTTARPEGPCLELRGAGLSCDAYHAAAPHPEGRGAFLAMQRALADAGLHPEDIGYINLHGTGTPDNDLAESKAVRRLFPLPPPLSSIKGATGHGLAAAGAVEAVVSTIALTRQLLPANTGLEIVDPLLGLTPLTEQLERPVQAVLSNSFGFGGNNGSLVLAAAGNGPRLAGTRACGPLAVHGFSCLSGAGAAAATIERVSSGVSAAGMAALAQISENLPASLIRRLKRLPRMSLFLAVMAEKDCTTPQEKADAVFMGTGWGALSETHDFLRRLDDSDEEFPSPIDFVGSVHNGPAGQVAIISGATGANITVAGGDYSFEQALLAADLLHEDDLRPALVLAADEGHAVFSPLFDGSISDAASLSDGGAAFCVSRKKTGCKCILSMPFFASGRGESVVEALIATLTSGTPLQSRYALILAGIPAGMRDEGEGQLQRFITLAGLSTPVVRYRRFTGEFASASAVAVAVGASFVEKGRVPGKVYGGEDIVMGEAANTLLVLGLGENITAMELYAG